MAKTGNRGGPTEAAHRVIAPTSISAVEQTPFTASIRCGLLEGRSTTVLRTLAGKPADSWRPSNVVGSTTFNGLRDLSRGFLEDKQVPKRPIAFLVSGPPRIRTSDERLRCRIVASWERCMTS
jgi:hypothetical protein